MLTPEEQAVLDFEDAHPRQNGRKDTQILDDLGLTTVRYYQILHRLVRRPDVIENRPLLAHRVQRRLDKQVLDRGNRRLSG